MPPAPKRNRSVILYDLNSKNQKNLRQGLFKVYCTNFFRPNKDLVNLVLVNSDKTDNRKHARFGKGFLHILEVNKEPEPFDPTIIYDKIEEKNVMDYDEKANWLEAILVAIDILKANDIKNIITNQILFLTDLSCTSPSIDDFEAVESGLKSLDIFLYIVGPQVKIPSAISDLNSVGDIMSTIVLEEENKFISYAKSLAEKNKKVTISDVKCGLQFFFNYKTFSGKQPWSVPITFGSKISFSVGTSKLLEGDKGLMLKPLSESFKDREYNYHSIEDSTKIYDETFVRKGISRHEKFIPIPDNDIFKSNNERMFSLFFITKLKNIPEYMMKGPGCYTVFSDKKAVEILISRLFASKSCMILKRVYNKGNRASYMVLIPHPFRKSFWAVQLSYGTEIPFERVENVPPKNQSVISEEVTDFLDKICINNPQSELKCPMTPNVVRNVSENAMIALAGDKFLKEKLHLEQVSLNIFDTGISPNTGEKLRNIWKSRESTKIEEVVKNEDLGSDEDDDYF